MKEVVRGTGYVGYEYLEKSVPDAMVSLYIDCYRNFGWMIDENLPSVKGIGRSMLKLKRDRKIMNRVELTRLQHHFEACATEIESMERSKISTAQIASLSVGFIGTAFIAGSVFAVTAQPPIVWLCVLLAIPGFVGWGLAPLVYKLFFKRKSERLTPFIEKKYDELNYVCEKGTRLLHP